MQPFVQPAARLFGRAGACGRAAARLILHRVVAGGCEARDQAARRVGWRAWALGRHRPLDQLNTDEHKAASLEMLRLREEHRDLDAAIVALTALKIGDQIQLQRLKKRKLILRDRIGHLEDQLTPDIIA